MRPGQFPQREDRVTIGNSTDPGPSAEYWTIPEPLQPNGEYAGVEQPAEEPHAANEDGTLTGAPQRDAAGMTRDTLPKRSSKNSETATATNHPHKYHRLMVQKE